MIKTVYSHRFHRNVYQLDTRVGSKRIVRLFLEKADAEQVAYKTKHEAGLRRYGLTVAEKRPLLSELIIRRLANIKNKHERTRATRVLAGLQEIAGPDAFVDEVSKATVKRYVDKREYDGLCAQSIDRELNIICAMFNSADEYFHQLEQWRPPKMPRPKIVDGRRERVWSAEEITKILGELFSPKRDDEQVQAATARYRVGRKVQFCLLNGLRHGEMLKIPKVAIDWDRKQASVRQKNGNMKIIGPMGDTAMEILREFVDVSKTGYVFSRSGNICPKFYRILRTACEKTGVPYGRKTPNGLVLHDARHTATTHLLESGVSPKTAQDWMGWSMSAFVLYYSHASMESRAQAGAALERLAGEARV
jgi:integrase